MSIRLKLTLLLLCLFVGAIANSAFTFRLENFGDEKLNWVVHTHDVLDHTHALLSSMTDVETGQRGYLITSNLSYLEPYHNGITESKRNLSLLQEMTADNPSQQELLALISNEMTLKFDEMAKTIEFVQNGQKEKAVALVSQDIGKQYMDNIRRYLNEFTSAEQILLEQRKGDFRENRAKITTLMAVEIVFFIGLAIFTLSFLQRNFFVPLQLLVSSTRLVENGKRLQVMDVLEKNEMGHLLSTFYRMSEKVHHREKTLEHKAHHDELTGLKNRMSIYDELDTSISLMERAGDKIAVMFLDLNLFKKINDTLGHDVGDQILIETADRLVQAVRSSDTVFRLGGDEFVIIVRQVHSTKDVEGVVLSILKAFEPPAMVDGHSIDISTSIGVAMSPDDSTNSDDLVKYADLAMYEAKKDKKAHFKIFTKDMLRRDSDINAA
ncbi:diguanylate cyclase [Enterovibrio sp. ZSDZ35]|uniref:Diguanylate cyclase n=1 Tax=Enterovibrio qingdaonensis TaxID=2899818 RepID=A0ABT5QHC3_9GAMM|nr:diguanylate cyclase [Enterovibrio sp. ZSDZ35]MDD1779746.1 diguanylate cyclase [Enterovibrio sp. ZSDZ35]